MGKIKSIIGWLIVACLIVAIPIVWATTVDDDMWFSKGAALGNDSTSVLRTDTVEISNSEIKALRATPKNLVVAPGTGKFLQFIEAVLILDYATNVLTESDDNLVIQYDGGQDASATIETSAWLVHNADAIAVIPAATIAHVASASVVNDALELFNSGNGEIAGNAGLDTTITVKITYIIHDLGL